VIPRQAPAPARPLPLQQLLPAAFPPDSPENVGAVRDNGPSANYTNSSQGSFRTGPARASIPPDPRERTQRGEAFIDFWICWGGSSVSIVRIGLAETKHFAEGYEAIFGKKKKEEAKAAEATEKSPKSKPKKKKAGKKK
jgi:hypothetical protein